MSWPRGSCERARETKGKERVRNGITLRLSIAQNEWNDGYFDNEAEHLGFYIFPAPGKTVEQKVF